MCIVLGVRKPCGRLALHPTPLDTPGSQALAARLGDTERQLGSLQDRLAQECAAAAAASAAGVREHVPARSVVGAVGSVSSGVF